MIKTEEEIKTQKESGLILGYVLGLLKKHAKVGVNTKYLDELAEDEIRQKGGFPIFKGYQGFPTAICTSINSEVVHGPARPARTLRNGDLLSIDAGVRYPSKNGMITDAAFTVGLGEISPEAKRLMEVTENSLNQAISKVKSGIRLGVISATVESVVKEDNFGIVREMVGHGVGRKLHEEPQIPNYGLETDGPILQAGMVLAIEPMVSMGDWRLKVGKNGAYQTRDNSLSAHFEHSVLVTEDGHFILTK